MKRFAGRLLSLFFPSRCACCGAVVSAGEKICPACEAALPKITGEICKICGRERNCCVCRGRHFEFKRCVAPFYYQGAAKRGLLRLKFCGKPDGAALFAEYALAVIRREYAGVGFDFVTSVPLSPRGLRERGYNQSELFGRAIAKGLGLRYFQTLEKPCDIKPQHTCPGENRWGNVFGAFVSNGDFGGKTVLLVDDIQTTGATLNECAKILKLAGAKDVFCAVAACVRKEKRS